MKDTNSSENIRRYLDQKMDPTKANEPLDQDMLLESLWDLSGKAVHAPKFDRSNAWRAFRKTNGIPSERPWIKFVFVGMAAVALLLLGVYLWHIRSGNEAHPAIPGLEVAQLHHEVDLPDGSSIRTTDKAALIADPSFDNRHRVVRLSGNAYCDIRSDKENPFTIQTPNGDIQVLGTAFYVVQDNESVTVAVTEGTVTLSHNEKKALLTTITAGQQATLSGKTGILSVIKDEQEKQLFMDNAPLDELVKQFNQLVGQERAITYDNELGACLITSRWDPSDPASIGEELGLLFGADWALKGTSIHIRSLNCGE